VHPFRSFKTNRAQNGLKKRSGGKGFIDRIEVLRRSAGYQNRLKMQKDLYRK
jgi:hypothetical protein